MRKDSESHHTRQVEQEGENVIFKSIETVATSHETAWQKVEVHEAKHYNECYLYIVALDCFAREKRE